MRIIRKRAHARAGLIGNPSDGYHGKTIAFTMQQFSAEVVLYSWERLEIVWSRQDKNRFDSLQELVEDVSLNGYYGGVRLVKATIKRFAEFCASEQIPLHDEPFSVRYDSNIPRGVGLSGSSAIVVATLRCLLEYYQADIPPDVQASLARAVENDELQIRCGYQDRVAQVYDGLVYMDFGPDQMRCQCGFECGSYQTLSPSLLKQAYVLYDTESGKPSDHVHGPLFVRVQDDRRLQATMAEIADLVPQARDALLAGDQATLHRLLNRNFDLRSSLYPIARRHLEMIEAARGAGASAKFAGSGGAIVGTYADADVLERLRAIVHRRVDQAWRLLTPQIVPPDAGADG